MAMKIGGRYEPDDVSLRHWHRLVADTAGARKAMETSLVRMARRTLDQAVQLKADLEEKEFHSVIFDSILAVIEQRSARILSGA
jgi:hypothetical protein